MFLTSFNATAKMLGPKNWRILHKVGLYWLFIAFTQTQLPDSLDELNNINWMLLVLIAAALVIRLTAYFAQRQRSASG
jgi:DMSO/TMAO reductase YedYZ heme-binding membrane subunit